MKKYANSALIYAILAMVGGVFFREFTKFNGFEGATTLAFVHTHYFALGMIVFLLLVLLENALHITDAKVSRAVTAYHIGLNATAAMLVVRGVPQVLGIELAHGMDAAISGVAGLGHIVLGVSIVLILLGGEAHRLPSGGVGPRRFDAIQLESANARHLDSELPPISWA